MRGAVLPCLRCAAASSTAGTLRHVGDRGGRELWYLARIMGTSVVQLEDTYVRWLKRTDEQLRVALDAYDQRAGCVLAATRASASMTETYTSSSLCAATASLHPRDSLPKGINQHGSGFLDDHGQVATERQCALRRRVHRSPSHGFGHGLGIRTPESGYADERT